MDDPHYDRASALRRQRELVAAQSQRLAATARALDDALAALAGGRRLQEDTMFNPLEQEAEERWGRHARLPRVQAPHGPLRRGGVALDPHRGRRNRGRLRRPAGGRRGPARRGGARVAERHRRHISRWFYDCSLATHRGLGEMYVGDPRCTAYWDERAPGLAAFVRDAILANADAVAVDG